MKVGELGRFVYAFEDLVNVHIGRVQKLISVSSGNQKEFDDGSGNKISLNYVQTIHLDIQAERLQDKHGIYIFYDPETEEVIYIGKADNSSISARAWGFFKVAGVKANESYTFPDTEREVNKEYFAKHPDAKIIINQKIKAGALNVIGIEIEPQWYASLFESAALAYVKSKDGCLPPVNISY